MPVSSEVSTGRHAAVNKALVNRQVNKRARSWRSKMQQENQPPAVTCYVTSTTSNPHRGAGRMSAPLAPETVWYSTCTHPRIGGRGAGIKSLAQVDAGNHPVSHADKKSPARMFKSKWIQNGRPPDRRAHIEARCLRVFLRPCSERDAALHRALDWH